MLLHHYATPFSTDTKHTKHVMPTSHDQGMKFCKWNHSFWMNTTDSHFSCLNLTLWSCPASADGHMSGWCVYCELLASESMSEMDQHKLAVRTIKVSVANDPCAAVKQLNCSCFRPDLVDMSKVSVQSSRSNLEQAFSVAEQLGVARLLDPEGESQCQHSLSSFFSKKM